MFEPLSLITGALGTFGNVGSTLINNQHNEQLVREQNEWNLEQWNRENLYNTPIEQMKRLKAANLNPNLMYGNGAGSLLSASSPTMQSARTEAPQIDPLVAAQIANIDADTDDKRASATLKDKQGRLTIAQESAQNLQNFILNSNIDDILSSARQQYRALGMSSTKEYFESAFVALQLASFMDGFAENEASGTNQLLGTDFEFSNRLKQKFIELGLSYQQQVKLERDLYSSYVESQKKINVAAGEEADMDSIIPSLINDCPRWLQPFVVGAWQLFKTARVPSFSFGSKKQ